MKGDGGGRTASELERQGREQVAISPSSKYPAQIGGGTRYSSGGYSGSFFTDQLPRGAGGSRSACVRAWPPNALAAALGAQLHRGIGSRRSVNLALRFSWTLCLLILPPRPRPPAFITLCRCPTRLTRRSSLGCTLIPFSDIDVDARSPISSTTSHLRT